MENSEKVVIFHKYNEKYIFSKNVSVKTRAFALEFKSYYEANNFLIKNLSDPENYRIVSVELCPINKIRLDKLKEN